MNDSTRQGPAARGRWHRAARQPGTVVLTCALVEEAVSARLDGEEAPLEEVEIIGHLAHCPSCRRFEQAASHLGGRPAVSCAPVRAADGAVATVIARSRPNAGAALLARLPARLPVRPRRSMGATGVPWAVSAMAVGIALPFAAITALTHTHTAAAHLPPDPCSVLLLRHAFAK